MNKHNYSSILCEYCPCTGYGDEPVNTGSWNICEGVGCEQAYDMYKDANPEDDRELEEMF